ncbi:MAG: hypothetical protein ACK5BV_08780 [Bacteroidota bacterium]
MVKSFIAFLFLTTVFFQKILLAQKLQPAQQKLLQAKEDSLKAFAFKIIKHEDAAVRLRSDSNFTRIIVRALKTPYSFEYPFDSLITISKLVAPDSSFRIFTWQLVKDESYCRQKGFIQMRTSDGSLQLFPLRDVSEFTEDPVDTIANQGGWIGAVYYKMITKAYQGKKYYTLLGYDEHNERTTRKWIDILHFDQLNQPIFGLQNGFSFAEDSIPGNPQNRILLEYKKDARARIQFDEEMDIILFDHLISETNESKKKYTLIPDGDYEGFVWKNGQWMHINKVFTQKLEDGQAPVPMPYKDKEPVVPPSIP